MAGPAERKRQPGSISITGRRSANDNQQRKRDAAQDELESYERPNREPELAATLEDAPDSAPQEPRRRAEP